MKSSKYTRNFNSPRGYQSPNSSSIRPRPMQPHIQRVLFDKDQEYSPVSFHKHPKDNPLPFFCAEASDICYLYNESPLELYNVLTKKSIIFNFKSVVKDASNEDILVYIYQAVEGAKFPCEFHILND